MENTKTTNYSGSIHLHSEFSDKDGAGKIKSLVAKTKELGANKFALTDHGTMMGIFEAWDVCEKEGMDFIPGCELYVNSEDSDEVYHMIMLCKNMNGYHGLAKLLSRAEFNKIKEKPVVNREMLNELFAEGKAHHGDVIVTTACIQGELPMIFLHNKYVERKVNKALEKSEGLATPNDEEYKTLVKNLENANNLLEIIAKRKAEIEPISKRVFGKKLNSEKTVLKSKGMSDSDIENVLNTYSFPENYVADDEEIALFDAIKNTEKAKKELEDIKPQQKAAQKEKSAISKAIKEYEAKFTSYNKIVNNVSNLKESIYSKEDMQKRVKELLGFYKTTFGNDFYIEVQNHGMEEEAYVMPKIVQIAKSTGISLVASNDIHIVNKEDVHKRQLIKAKRFNKWEEADVADKELYIKTDAELAEMLMKILPADAVNEAIENISVILSQCDCKRQKETHYPKAILPEGVNADDELERICRENISKRYSEGEWDEAHEERLKYELDVIKTMGFSDYHLIEQDICEAGILYGYIPTEKLPEAPLDKEELEKYCKDNGYNVGMGVGIGRGSAAGSIVCYLLNITHIEPMKYDLLFERFLNVERVTMPDIDSDFEPEVRKKLVEYVSHKFGAKSVSQIVTKGTQAAKGSVRNCARYYGDKVSGDSQKFAGLADQITKLIPSIPGTKLQDAIEILNEKFGDNKDAVQIINDALEVEGFYTQSGQHAAGVIIAPEDIENIVPTMVDDNGGLKTQCDMIVAEKLGMLKFDFLVLKNLTYISRTLKNLKKKGIEVDLYNLDFESEVLKEVYADGNTTAVFQFDGFGIREMLKRFKPTSFEDVILMNASYRPGPMDSIPAIISAKNSGIIECPIPELEPILGKTYGEVIYQEQVMDIFKKLAGFSLGQADLVRRAMSKKHLDEVLAEKQAFLYGDESRNIDGCEKRGIDLIEAEKLFERITEFAKYAFNKSHAAVYSYVSYITAYLKHHYPAEFLSCVMDEAKLEKLPLLIRECERYGIKVLPPSINESNAYFTVCNDKEIRFGLSKIKSVGKSGEVIIEARKEGPFVSIKDFLKRCKVDKGDLEALVKAGAFDSFTESRKALLSVIKDIKDAVVRVENASTSYNKAAEIMEKINRGETVEKMDAKKAFKKLETEKNKLENEKLNLNSLFIPMIPDNKEELLKDEHEFLGTYVSDHPLNQYITSTTIDCLTPSKGKNDNREVVGVVTNARVVARKKDGKQMAFFTLEDKTGLIEVACFVNEYEKYKSFIEDGEVIKLVASCYVEQSEEENTDEEVEEVLKLITKEVMVADKIKETICIAIPSLAEWHKIKQDIAKYFSNKGAKLVVYDEELAEFRTLKTPIFVSDLIFESGYKVKKIG